MVNAQNTAYLKALIDEVRGLRSQIMLGENLRRSGVIASVLAALADDDNKDSPDKIVDVDVDEVDETVNASVNANVNVNDYGTINEQSEDSSHWILDDDDNNNDNNDIEPKLTTIEVERIKKTTTKGDSKTQLVEWMLQQSQSDDDNKWYIYRVMKNTLPLADILYEMPEDISVGRTAMVKLFSAIRRGDYDKLLQKAVDQGLDHTKVFVASRVSINAAPPAAKRGRKNK